MTKLLVSALALALFSCASQAALAQSASSIAAPAGFAPLQAPCVRQADSSCAPVSTTAPLPVATNGKTENFTLASANAAASASTVYGGSYVLNQACAGYASGSLTLRYRGPDGATMVTLVSKSASDSAGGTPVTLGGGTVVDVTLPSGSTGCNASLVRVP